jgi:hypothetical protein
MRTYRIIASEDITTGSSSAQSGAAPSAGVRAVRLVVATAAARVRIGSDPTAVAADTLLPVGVPEVFVIGEGEKVAAIQDSAAGKVNVSWLV